MFLEVLSRKVFRRVETFLIVNLLSQSRLSCSLSFILIGEVKGQIKSVVITRVPSDSLHRTDKLYEKSSLQFYLINFKIKIVIINNRTWRINFRNKIIVEI